MQQQEIKQRINKSAFDDLLKQKKISQGELADKIGAQPKSFNRWINDGYVQSQYVWDMVETLDLSEDEIGKILLVPKFQVFFRKKFLGEVPDTIRSRAVELAQTFFNLTYLNSNAKFCPPNLSKIDSIDEVASQIRRYLEISSFTNLQGIVSLLAERGIEVAVVPFDKLNLCSTGDYESAFSVTDGSRFIIFLDAGSPEEALVFFLCHELTHLFRPDVEFSKIEERFCNDVAAELTYPHTFFEVHRAQIQGIIDSKSSESIIHMLNVIKDNLGGEPFGICLRLKALGFFSQKDPLHSKVVGFAKKRYDNSEQPLAKYFSNFNSEDKSNYFEFWANSDLVSSPLMRFFMHIKNGITDESISARRFAELFNIDLAIADELARKWRFELQQNLKD